MGTEGLRSRTPVRPLPFIEVALQVTPELPTVSLARGEGSLWGNDCCSVMQCLQHPVVPGIVHRQVHARSSKQQKPPHSRTLTTQDLHCNPNLQYSRTASVSTVGGRRTSVLSATMQNAAVQTTQQAHAKTLLCTSVTASTFEQALVEIRQIAEAGADLIELRLDMLTDFAVEEHLQQLLATTDVPKVVTMRPVWEGSACLHFA